MFLKKNYVFGKFLETILKIWKIIYSIKKSLIVFSEKILLIIRKVF